MLPCTYYNLSTYLRNTYGHRLGKLCIDGGFTCPNRDGTCGVGGCIFCGERGAGEHIVRGSIAEQAKRYFDSPASAKYSEHIVYFQNFTGTYAPPETLYERYASALDVGGDSVRVLAVGTRPDCIDEKRADTLASFITNRRDVWCELGLQTASDETARFINRGYGTARFADAVHTLHSRGIKVVAHMMIGLPRAENVREDAGDVAATVDLINSLPVFGVKIHSLYVMRGTRLCDLYERGLYTPLTLDEYASLAASSISRLRPDIVLHRITGDCNRDMLAAPMWCADKRSVIAAIEARLRAR